jgi:hypothetical protein
MVQRKPGNYSTRAEMVQLLAYQLAGIGTALAIQLVDKLAYRMLRRSSAVAMVSRGHHWNPFRG